MVVDAGSVKVAAYQLGVHVRTVEGALERARTRAGVDTSLQLVRELARRGELEA